MPVVTPRREPEHVTETERARRVAADEQGGMVDNPAVVALGPCDRCGRIHRHCKGHVNRVVDWDGIRREPCRKNARQGQLVCHNHGGNQASNLARAGKLLEEQRVLGEVGRILQRAHLVLEGQDLGAQLVGALNTAGAMALSYRWLLDQLDETTRWSWIVNEGGERQPVRWVAIDPEREPGLLGPDQHGVQRLHAYEEGLRYWTKLHGELLVKAATLGLEERRHLFEEQQVNRIGDAIIGIVHGLGRDLDDPQVVPVVEAALKAITAGAVEAAA